MEERELFHTVGIVANLVISRITFPGDGSYGWRGVLSELMWKDPPNVGGTILCAHALNNMEEERAVQSIHYFPFLYDELNMSNCVCFWSCDFNIIKIRIIHSLLK